LGDFVFAGATLAGLKRVHKPGAVLMASLQC